MIITIKFYIIERIITNKLSNKIIKIIIYNKYKINKIAIKKNFPK